MTKLAITRLTIFCLVLVISYSLGVSPVFAVSPTPKATNTPKATSTPKNTPTPTKVIKPLSKANKDKATSVSQKYIVSFKSIITKTESLGTKLQKRLDAAKKQGKDVVNIEKAMKGATTNLNDAKLLTSSSEKIIQNLSNKKEVEDVRDNFKSMKADLEAVQTDYSRVVKQLKDLSSPKESKTSSTNK